MVVLNIFCIHHLKARPTERVWLQLWAPINGFWKILMSVLVPANSEVPGSFLVSVTGSVLMSLPLGREMWCSTGTSLAQEKVSSTQIMCIPLFVGQSLPKIFRRSLRKVLKPVRSFWMVYMGTEVPWNPWTSALSYIKRGPSPAHIKRCDWEPVTLKKNGTALQEQPFQVWEE